MIPDGPRPLPQSRSRWGLRHPVLDRQPRAVPRRGARRLRALRQPRRRLDQGRAAPGRCTGGV